MMQGRVHYYEGYPMQDVVTSGASDEENGCGDPVSDQCRRWCSMRTSMPGI